MAGFGGKIELTGASEYKSAIKDINSQLRVLGSEMKLTASTFDKTDKSEDGLKKTTEGLNKQIDQQKQKIDTIKQALQLASEKYGENSSQANNWKAKLNDAERDLNNLNKELKNHEKALDENTDGLEEFTDAENDAGQGAIKLGDLIKANLISDAIKSGIKALANAMLEVGKACIDIGKQSLESYANYEQLVGGVETLFKDSADKVKQYSEVAYRTAGLSANEYMETVTSFSASLLQGLGGDTEKASEISNKAIIDMSDNANKMGTSMESIQNAYQGFAKQNYTMLDNLKLGYGGTKSEMARLVKESGILGEAGKNLTAKNLDEKVSFDQIIEAIHVMQERMGIAGTTSLEASTTIEGSVNSMKSAWQNLITGIAGDGENLDRLIEEFTNSVMTASSNIIPVIERIVKNGMEMLPKLIAKITEHLPELITKGIEIVDNLAKGIQDNLPTIMQSALDTIQTLVSGLTERLPDILQMGCDILFKLIEGIAETLPDLVPQVVNIIIKIMETFNANFPKLVELGVKVILGLIEGIIKSIPQILANLPTIVTAIVNFFTLSKFLSMGKTVVSGLLNGLKNSFPNVMSEIPKMVGNMINSFKNGGWSQLGRDIIRGICSGLTSMGNFIWEAVKKVGNSITSGIKSFFGIHSPSKKMKDEVGTYLAQGIGVGFEDEMTDVTKDMQNAIPTSFDTGVNLSTSSALNDINGSTSFIDYNRLAFAIKDTLEGMNVVLDREKVGEFVTYTVGKEVFG